MEQKRVAKQRNLLPVLTGIVLIAAVVITLLPKAPQGDSSADPESITPDNDGGLVVRIEEIGTAASYFDYDVDGTTVQFFCRAGL